jgi:release factor glutamine methyltransferase
MKTTKLQKLKAKSQKTGIPLDYLLGQVKILDTNFCLTPSVLIPRWETELLVNSLIKLVTENKLENSPALNLPLEIKKFFKNSTIWDLGCGSGFIGILLQKYLPQTEVIFSDKSKRALKIAQKNYELNELKPNKFYLSDLLSSPDLRQKLIDLSKKQNLVLIANLPYVPVVDLKFQKENNVSFEPKMAIYAGTDGLLVYKKLLKQIQEFKIVPKLAIFELDPRNIQLAQKLLTKIYSQTQIIQDLENRERFLLGWN